MEEVKAPHILNLDITEASGELHDKAALSPQNSRRHTFDGVPVGQRAGLDAVEKITFPSFAE